jgi:hypothetical protein
MGVLWVALRLAFGSEDYTLLLLCCDLDGVVWFMGGLVVVMCCKVRGSANQRIGKGAKVRDAQIVEMWG